MVSCPCCVLQFSDQLEDMLDNLTLTAEQVKHAEPISAHPDKLREQIEENKVAWPAVKRDSSDRNLSCKKKNKEKVL